MVVIIGGTVKWQPHAIFGVLGSPSGVENSNGEMDMAL